MKRIITLLIITILMLPICVLAKGSISVSTKNITLTEGGSASFKVSASNAAGRIDISIQDSGIASISKTNAFLDNDSTTIKVNAKKIGTTKITVKLSDAATYDEETLSGTYTITVTVKEKTTTTKKSTTATTKKTETTALDESNNLKDLCAFNYTCTKVSDTTYRIVVPENTNSINIIATKESEKSTIAGLGNKDLTDGENKFTITVTSESGQKKDYILEVVKESNKEVDTQTKEEINYYKIASIVELVFIIMLIAYIIINKKK